MERQTQLVCPKCGGPMRSYERNGIVIDQCTDCRGVFLDRGELERLIDAEAQYQRPAAAVRDDDRWDRDQRDHERRDHDRRDFGGFPKKKKKKHGFLGEIFDLD